MCCSTLRLQYFADEREQEILLDQRRRHFESGVDLVFEGRACGASSASTGEPCC